MTYPSQPGYPTPQYGGQSPQPQQQNNLWLIGGAVLTVLIVIMTVILLVVQRTQGSDSDNSGGGDGSSEGTDGGGESSEDTGGGDDGGDDNGGDQAAIELTSEACDAFDMSVFEEAFGPVDPNQTSRSESSTNGLGTLSCSFYNEDVSGVNLRVSDYETVDEVVDWVEYDAEYYTAADGYEFSEYTEYGDAGSLYSTTEGSKTITLHVAVGSLDVSVFTTLWDGEGLDEAAATAALEDMVVQCGDLFADYT
ncbi:hypothetical protein [Glycomyces sp. NPDC048151]|uniref:hypothetical protein n=1 Tax=Glycomyces sp. NPDC048151 TaxID=3364002 RepID=UPI00371A45D9